MLLGTDVKALFPSLSAQRTGKAVRQQVEKSLIKWEEIDEDWLTLYIHLNEKLCSDLTEIEHLLPRRRRGRRGPEAGMGSEECMAREINHGEDSNWIWPVRRKEYISYVILKLQKRRLFQNKMNKPHLLGCAFKLLKLHLRLLKKNCMRSENFGLLIYCHCKANLFSQTIAHLQSKSQRNATPDRFCRASKLLRMRIITFSR